MADGGWKRESHLLTPVGDDVRSLKSFGIQLKTRHLVACGRKPTLGLRSVAAARQSAANLTGVFQMAAFSRKPLRRAKPFHFFNGRSQRAKTFGSRRCSHESPADHTAPFVGTAGNIVCSNSIR